MVPGIALLVVGGLLVIAEINTMTFYLLAVAVGCFAAGAASVHGVGLDYTFGILGGTTFLCLPLAHWARVRLSNPEADSVSQDDVGRTVLVQSVTLEGLRVSYRGSVWTGRMAEGPPNDAQQGQALRIAGRDGNVLLLERIAQTDNEAIGPGQLRRKN